MPDLQRVVHGESGQREPRLVEQPSCHVEMRLAQPVALLVLKTVPAAFLVLLASFLAQAPSPLPFAVFFFLAAGF